MTDFGPLIANPKELVVGRLLHRLIFATFLGALALGFQLLGGRLYRYYRWCRWSYGYLPYLEVGSPPLGPHRRSRLLVYGSRSRDSASYYRRLLPPRRRKIERSSCVAYHSARRLSSPSLSPLSSPSCCPQRPYWLLDVGVA